MPCDRGLSSRITLPSAPLAVREALASLVGSPVIRSLPQEDRLNAEILLAEVLNNCVEHAYGDGKGEIEVSLALRRGRLACEIVDRGRPMAGRTLPPRRDLRAGAAPPLAEGGFGWHIIRALARDLAYRNENGVNRLTFRLGPAEADCCP